MKPFLTLLLKGMAMGVAEVIPGVSGGTLAFITGIYERLLQALEQLLTPQNLYLLPQKKWSEWWKKIDGYFLLQVLLGMVMGIGLGVVFITHLLRDYPPAVWAFFFGLILGSAVYVGCTIQHWRPSHIVGLLSAALFAWYITGLPAIEGNHQLWYVFTSGAIAITALVLPGISGSFMLLIMGMYLYIIDENLKGLFISPTLHSLIVLLVFGAGAALGLVTIIRGLNYLLRRYRDTILVVLTGFMIGALNKIWPWKNVTIWLNKESLETVFGPLEQGIPAKVIQAQNVLPKAYLEGPPLLFVSLMAFVVGCAIVLLMARYSAVNSKEE